ncbi:MAG: YhjD/YihY/BrkB family envelope integrity protein, partial [Streptosporangiaceae bacterium]
MASASSLASRVSNLTRTADRIQQGHGWLAMGVATWKKFSDDRAGNLAALVAYYAFASVFPLLLVAYTILDLLARGSPTLADRLTRALQDYPVIGNNLTVGHPLNQTGLALVIGILLLIYASKGVANAIQNAMNDVWAVPRYQRPRFPKNLARSMGLLAVLGPGEIITIALSTIAGGAGHLGGVGAKIAAVVVSLLLNIILFWLGFRIATSKEVRGRDLRLGAILAAIAWQILQLAGTLFITHSHSNSAYGTFGVVLGLLAWFYLQAQITLYAVELDVVRARRLWPRSLAPPPLTDADLRAFQAYANSGQLRPDLDITVAAAPQPADQPRAAGQPPAADHPAPPADHRAPPADQHPPTDEPPTAGTAHSASTAPSAGTAPTADQPPPGADRPEAVPPDAVPP